MADNRLDLVYRPTGARVRLGKRMGDGWYGVPPDLAAMLTDLFNAAEEFALNTNAPVKDDFVLEFEMTPEREPRTAEKRERGE